MDKGTCPGCRTLSDFIEIEKVNNYSVLRCLTCSLEFSNPMAAPNGDWYNKAYSIRHIAIDSRKRDYYKGVITSLPIKGRLLDIGCGEGTFVNYAREKGFDAYGIDFSEDAIEIGRNWYGLTTIYTCSSLRVKEIQECAERFDVVTFFEVLEHLESPKRFLEEIKTLLKPGGYVGGSVPFRDRWPLREFNDFPPHHLTRWTETSIKRLFQVSGLEIVSIVIGSKLRSYHSFLSYLLRILIYYILGKYHKGVEGKKGMPKFFKNTRIKRFFSALRPRQVRDMFLWPLAVLTYPFAWHWFNGYNIIFIAKRKN